jgi:hypothetical protein
MAPWELQKWDALLTDAVRKGVRPEIICEYGAIAVN